MERILNKIVFVLLFLPLFGWGQVITNGLIAHWKLNDNAATAAVDENINGYDGVLKRCAGVACADSNTSTAATTGKVGGAFTFLTGGAYDANEGVRVADNDAFTFGNGTSDSPFSIGAWVYLSSWKGIKSGTAYLSYLCVKRYNATNGHEYQLYFNFDTVAVTYQVRCVLYSSQNTTNRFARFTNDLTESFINKWHYVLMTYDATEAATGIDIYIDGVNQSGATSTTGTYAAMNNTTSDFGIGTWAFSSTLNSYSINGKIDEVSIWNRELSAGEALQLYQQNALLWHNF